MIIAEWNTIINHALLRTIWTHSHKEETWGKWCASTLRKCTAWEERDILKSQKIIRDFLEIEKKAEKTTVKKCPQSCTKWWQFLKNEKDRQGYEEGKNRRAQGQKYAKTHPNSYTKMLVWGCRGICWIILFLGIFWEVFSFFYSRSRMFALNGEGETASF